MPNEPLSNEPLSPTDLESVEALLHAGRGEGKEAAVTEGARPVLGPPPRHADDLVIGQQLRHLFPADQKISSRG